MHREEILTMEAGRPLDGLVGKEIMGIEVEYPHGEGYPFYLVKTGRGGMAWDTVLFYSTTISGAWPVARKMGLGVFPLNNGDWACCRASYLYHLEVTQDHYSDPNLVICKEAPEAICKMALIIKEGALNG
ncbi:hypothetical protein ES703_76453 [subsurface metagenome]